MKINLKTIVIGIFTSIFLIPSVHADLMPPIISNTFRQWFGSGVPDDYVLRSLITLLIFLIFYWAGGALFKKGSHGFGDSKMNMFRWTIALIIALIVGLFTPMTLLQTYKTIFLLAVPLLGTIGILVLGHKAAKQGTSEGYLAAAILYLFILVVISLTLAKASSFGITDYKLAAGFSFIDMLEILIFVFFILMVVNFFKAFGIKAPKGDFFRQHHRPAPEGEPPAARRRREEEDRRREEERRRREREHRPETPEEHRREEVEKRREEAEDKQEEKAEHEEEKEEKKEERLERAEIKRGVRIFNELKHLKDLMMEWLEASGAPTYRKQVLEELERIRKDESIMRTLEKYSIREVKKIDYLEHLGNRMGGKHEERLEQLIRQEVHLSKVFEELLDYISKKIDELEFKYKGAPPEKKNFNESEFQEPKKEILSAINKALQVSVERINVEKQEFSETEEAEKDTKKAEHAHH